ncbi:MAG: AAA family ATPase, partial [Gammaproteobacteria bacterium]
NLEVQVRHIENGHVDPLHGVNTLPRVLVLDLSGFWKEELHCLTQRARHDAHMEIIVIGSEADAEMLRLSMRAGAREFFGHPVARDDLCVAVRRLMRDTEGSTGKGKSGQLTAVINAKGGSGASFLSANVAHCITAKLKLGVALLDLDLQFGALPLYFDMAPRESILTALSAADHLDSIALEGYMLKHKSGMRLLASSNDDLARPWDVPEENLTRLLMQAVHDYEHIFVDLPRQIDRLTSTTLEHANYVLVVLQQSVTHVRDAQRMVRIMTRELGVPRDRIHAVVNRYDKNSPVTVQDIAASTEAKMVHIVPNDYARVSEAINIGVPMGEAVPNAPITRAIEAIATEIAGHEHHPKPKGLIESLFARLSQ